MIGRDGFGKIARGVALAAAFALAAPAGYTPPPLDELLAHADRSRGGGLPGIVWKVHVQSRNGGDVSDRQLVVSASGDDSLVEMVDPPKVRGQRLLTRGRNLWFSRPGLQKPVAISPRQRLLGDAANGDVASTNYAGDYRGTLAGEGEVDGRPCWVLELSAARSGVTYDHIRYYVTKEKLLGIKAEFFTGLGKLLKTATFEYGNRIRHGGSTRPFVSRMVIVDALQRDATTVLQYSDVKVSAIPASAFNLELLGR